MEKLLKNDIHFFYKVLAFFIFCLGLLFINNIVFKLIMVFLFFYTDRKFNELSLFFGIMLLVLLLFDYFLNTNYIGLMLVISYIYTFTKHYGYKKYKEVYEFFNYKERTYKDLRKSEYKNLKKDNEKELENKENLEGEIINKTDEDIEEVVKTNYIRFYKNKNDLKKNYYLNLETYILLGISFVFFIVCIIL